MTTYQASAMPAYARYTKSTAPHLSVTSFDGLTAFRAGPRRDPLSREEHLRSLSERGAMPNRGTTPFGSSILPVAGVVVPANCPGSYETDIEEHSRRQPLMPAVGSNGLLSSGAAGASHIDLGHIGEEQRLRSVPVSQHYARLADGQTEEQKRLLLITKERARRHADKRWEPTDTLGFGGGWRQQFLYFKYMEQQQQAEDRAQQPPSPASHAQQPFTTPFPSGPASTPGAPARVRFP